MKTGQNCECCTDLAQAKIMLNMMLPKAETLRQIESNHNLRVSSHFEPCNITGGDFWGCMPVSCCHIAFYIADCSGHGFTSTLNAFRLHALLEDITDIYTKVIPVNILSVLNYKMCQLLLPGHFATLFYGVINVDDNVLTYASAGSTPPVLIRKGGQVEMLDSSGFPLGVNKDADYVSRKTTFVPGDRLLLYSDAMVETLDKGGKMLGEDHLVKLVRGNAKEQCEEFIGKIVDEQKNYRHGNLHDDLTLNVYHRL